MQVISLSVIRTAGWSPIKQWYAKQSTILGKTQGKRLVLWSGVLLDCFSRPSASSQTKEFNTFRLLFSRVFLLRMEGDRRREKEVARRKLRNEFLQPAEELEGHHNEH